MTLKIKSHRNGDETEERITLTVLKDCNLKDYMIVDETYDSGGAASNLHRHSFWFPDQPVLKDDIVRISTGKGKVVKATKDGVTTYDYYWGLGEAVWNNDGDKIILVKIADFTVATIKPKTRTP